jgi:preprotein translocase subunit YajC
MTELFLALAQAAPARQAQPDIWTMLAPMGIAIGIFYLLVFRPQQKQVRSHQQMLSSLQKGDQIITSGGLHGKVVEVGEKSMIVEIADKVKVRIERQAITGVIRGGTETRVEEPPKG